MIEQTYYLTRSSNSSGDLSPVVDVWYRRPIRRKLAAPGKLAYTWLPSDPSDPDADWREDTGYYGVYTLDYCRGAFGVVPDTDRECVVCVQQRKEQN